MCRMEAPSSWKIVKLFFYENEMRNQRKESEAARHCAAIGAVEVLRRMSFHAFGKREKLRAVRICTWEELKASVANIFNFMMTILMQKHCEWQEDRRPKTRHGSVKRPAMYLACMDIKTAFYVTRPKHIARVVEDHNVLTSVVAAFLREMTGLEGLTMFECVENEFSFDRCIRQGSVEASQNMAGHVHTDPGKCGHFCGEQSAPV